jgi:CheY-like chemotaxis protein
MVFHGGEPLYILVVDDDRARGQNIARALRSVCDEEIEVLTAPDGNTALLIIAENPIEELSAIVTNYGLPGMTGGELAQHVADQWPEVDPLFVLWTKKIVPEVVSDRFRMIRAKSPDISDFAGAINEMLLAHRS